MPNALLELLDERARRRAFAPWIFVDDRLDWRWRSWAEMRSAVERWRSDPAPAEAPTEPGPAAVAAWLAGLSPDRARALVAHGERLAARRRSAEKRPVAIIWHLPTAPGMAQLLAWSLVAEAAVLCERRHSAVPATLLWARPTHLAATAAELESLAEELPGHSRGRDPLRRLHQRLSRLEEVWTIGPSPSPAVASFWTSLGPRLTPLE